MCSSMVGVTSSWPSPAQDYYQGPISLDRRYLGRPSRYVVRARGDLAVAGVSDGDVLIVDRGLDPTLGSLVVVVVDGEHRLAVLGQSEGRACLITDDQVTAWTQVRRWGVVIAIIRDVLPQP